MHRATRYAVGLRFRKRVKLLPGVHVNLSGGGASLSLGGRGATINLSKRGTTTTLGVPGTGISFQQKERASQHRKAAAGSPSAGPTKAEMKQLLAAAEGARIESEEQSYRQQLNSWRRVSLPFSVEATTERFASLADGVEQRQAETWREAEAALVAELRGQAMKETEPGLFSKLLRFVLLAVAALVSFMLAGLLLKALASPPLVFAAGILAAPSVVLWRMAVRKRQGREGLVEKMVAEQRALVSPELRHKIYDKEDESAKEARSLLSGDVSAIERAAHEAVEGLEVPYELTCAVEVADSGSAFVDLDLPEIEDVVRQTREKALASGSVKLSQKSAKELNSEYAGLAIGLSYSVAAAIFAAAPTLREIGIGAFTQRVSRKTGNLESEYVYQVMISRQVLSSLNLQRIDAREALANFEHVINVKTDGRLETIKAPAWVER